MSEHAAPAKQRALSSEAMRALSERFRASGERTCEAFRVLAAQLDATPTAPEVIEAIRRELHRVHGTAGTYGYHEASRLAAKLEERALRWAADPSLDREQRGRMIDQLAGVLALAFGLPVAPPMGHTEAEVPLLDFAGEIAVEADGPDVIVVEDDPALRDMLLYALKSTGHRVKVFATGPDALTALLAMPVDARAARRPLVLLDVDLPGLDGHSLHERLRVERPGVFAVVFQTAHAGEVEQLRALHGGAVDYVIKPLNLRVLLAKLPIWMRQGAD
jgi:CheY-like chemotaxis protein/HPt (histidine-containing phosphotransfer) domain-containing protein